MNAEQFSRKPKWSFVGPILACVLVVAGAGALGATRAGADEKPLASVIKNAPTNQWVKLEGEGGEKLAFYSAPVYVPSRGALMHWQIGSPTLKLFSPETAQWMSEKPDPAGVNPTALIDAVIKQKKIGWRGAQVLKPGKKQRVMNSGVWDSKRERIVYTGNRLMVAYDPKSKRWEDVQARAIINGREYPGGPPVFGAGACYDPVNDEIVMFPHFTFHSREGRHSPKNFDRREVDGRISNHLGTLRFSFEDKTWRCVADTFGTAEEKAARAALFLAMKDTSRAFDAACTLRRKRALHKPEDVDALLRKALSELKNVKVPRPAATPFINKAAAALGAAGKASAHKNWQGVIRHTADALWILNEDVIDGTLRVEPPPRCATAMVHHPGRKCIVMFGGRNGLVRSDLHGPGGYFGGSPGRLDDTWIYDCTNRQWRELACKDRPPSQDRARIFYDPAAGKVFLVSFTYHRLKNRQPSYGTELWSLDIDAATWTRHLVLKWKTPINTRDQRYEVGYDPVRSLLVFNQAIKGRGHEVHGMRLELASAPVTPAPERKPPPPLKPQRIPPDDPAWVAKLKALPPNRWVQAKPPMECGRRDWGNIACDPVRGHVYYFGGGHSTYQVNDVAIYAVGANRWSFAAGDHNDLLPPTHWGGGAMGYRGGKWAHHQRNAYVAVDGRMFVGVDPAWFYDLDRGGVWRQRTLDGRQREDKALNQTGVHVVSPDGRVMALLGQNMVSSLRNAGRGRSGFSSYNIYANTLEIRNVTAPFPSYVYEHRPLCFLPDRNRVFFYEHAGGKKALTSQRTMVFDIKANKWIDLKPAKQPFKGTGTVRLAEYIEGQDAVFCMLGNRNQKRTEYWVYSFKRNRWTCMNERAAAIGSPYGQAAYVARYGVLVAVPKTTRVMRLDVDKLKSD